MNREMYYQNPAVLFEIVKVLRGRETAFLQPVNTERAYPVRCIKAHKVDYLLNNMRTFHFLDRPYNLYHSIAHLMDMPMFNYSPIVRRQQQKDFNKDFKKYMVGYDLPLDFDVKNDEQMRKAVDEIIVLKDEILDHYKVPHTLKCSGSGFHIVVPFEALAKVTVDPIKQVIMARKWGLFVQDLLASEQLDLSIYDERRVWKAAYSWDVKTNRIALPLTDEQLANFNYDMVDPLVVSKRTFLKNRGELMRFEGSGGFKKLWQEVEQDDTHIREE